MDVIKPDLTKATTYQRSFYLQNTVPNVIKLDKEYDRLQGPHLDIDSIYRHSYKGRLGDQLDRPHPEDLLHSNGPSPNLSSYSTQFPGHKGDNQYVKPTDRHTRGYFPLRSKSTYSKEYVNKKPEIDDYTYFPDQLRTGSNWFGKTTYGSFFGSPNPEYQAKKVKNIEKKEENPNYKHQYGTSVLTKKPTTATNSPKRIILSVLLRCISRQKLKVPLKPPNIPSAKTQISRLFHQSSMLYRRQNTSTFDKIPLFFNHI